MQVSRTRRDGPKARDARRVILEEESREDDLVHCCLHDASFSARYASQYAWDDAHRVNGHAPNDAWHDARYDARNDDARHDAGNDDARHDDAWNDGVFTSDD